MWHKLYSNMTGFFFPISENQLMKIFGVFVELEKFPIDRGQYLCLLLIFHLLSFVVLPGLSNKNKDVFSANENQNQL